MGLGRQIYRWVGCSRPRDYRAVLEFRNKCLVYTTLLCIFIVTAISMNLSATIPISATLASLLSCVFYSTVLKRIVSTRNKYRKSRLALPYPLADGITAGESGNIERMARSIYARTMEEYEYRYLAIFDCIISDMLDEDPLLRQRLMDFAISNMEAV
jgi:hypothetical protein